MMPQDIRDLRSRLGLSQSELGTALGMRTDPARAIRGWEAGTRNGKPDAPAPPTIMAMLYLEAIVDALVYLRDGRLDHAQQRLNGVLPVAVREGISQ